MKAYAPIAKTSVCTLVTETWFRSHQRSSAYNYYFFTSIHGRRCWRVVAEPGTVYNIYWPTEATVYEELSSPPSVHFCSLPSDAPPIPKSVGCDRWKENLLGASPTDVRHLFTFPYIVSVKMFFSDAEHTTLAGVRPCLLVIQHDK